MTPPGKRRGGRARRGPGKEREPQHTSSSTSRAAYMETRRWLLKRHGPVCAYCGHRFKPEEMTLDHVTPRRGQSAYDRRDNLVLSCERCNALKADMPVLAFLLRDKHRAVSLARYGDHLSHMLVDLVDQIAGNDDGSRALRRAAEARSADQDSPYADAGYSEPKNPYREIPGDDDIYKDGVSGSRGRTP